MIELLNIWSGKTENEIAEEVSSKKSEFEINFSDSLFFKLR